MKINENLQTEVTAACDVLVCGGGFAGIQAALAAARLGSKVILLEKQFILGGLGTAGLVTIYLPLCDGCGRQVSFGIAEELLRLSVSMGAEDDYPDNWLNNSDISKRTDKDKRVLAQYNPQLFAILAEQLLIKHGVTILYGSYAVGVNKTSDRIDAVLIENKSGRQLSPKQQLTLPEIVTQPILPKFPPRLFVKGMYWQLGIIHWENKAIN